MTEESPPEKRISTRSNRGTMRHNDDFVYYGGGTHNKKLIKEEKLTEAAAPIAKIERRGRPKKVSAVASREVKLEKPIIASPLLDDMKETPRSNRGKKRHLDDSVHDMGTKKKKSKEVKSMEAATELTAPTITICPAVKAAPTEMRSSPPKIVSPLLDDMKETPRSNRGTSRQMDDFLYYGGTKTKNLREVKLMEAAKLTLPNITIRREIKTAPLIKKCPPIVYPAPRNQYPAVSGVRPTTRPATIRFLKPSIQSLGQKPQTSTDFSKMSAVRDAFFIQRPTSTVSTSSNGSLTGKENVRMSLHVQTNLRPSYKPQAQTPRSQASSNSSKDSPSIITFANYPNNLLSLEPNVKYCLVNQNGKLIYPANELEESSLEPSPSPPVYRFFEPVQDYPDYFLTVL